MSNPYTDIEKEIMDNLVAAVNGFSKIEQTHPNHAPDFVDGIHMCQHVIQHRILQRDYPDTFPTYKKDKSKPDTL